MKLVKYTLCDIELMMVDIEGTLYCSTPQLEEVFGADESNLTKLVRKHSEEFSKATCEILTRYNVPLKEILDGLGLKRLRKNTRLWSEDDVIGFTWLVRSDIARQCRAQFKEILKQHARRETVSREMYDHLQKQHMALLNQVPILIETIKEVKREQDAMKESQRQMASNAGRSLRLVRNHK